jgi:hypothetical protein
MADIQNVALALGEETIRIRVAEILPRDLGRS